MYLLTFRNVCTVLSNSLQVRVVWQQFFSPTIILAADSFLQKCTNLLFQNFGFTTEIGALANWRKLGDN